MTDDPGPEGWDAAAVDGATPLDRDVTHGLKLSWVATRGDLNAAEQANILKAFQQPRWTRLTPEQVLDDRVVRDLHQAMFGEVWDWAGRYRQRALNIGVDPQRVSSAVRDLVDRVPCWYRGDRPMPVDEVGYRFHHELVSIHPFPNGNGRHSRAMTDLLLRSLGGVRFTWGSQSLDEPGDQRSRYIAALRAADHGHLGPLASFVRS